jgi:hypothetical protein
MPNPIHSKMTEAATTTYNDRGDKGVLFRTWTMLPFVIDRGGDAVHFLDIFIF